MVKCDPITGACLLPEQDKPIDSPSTATCKDLSVRYIGDPMCSWCWGISPTIEAVETFCETNGIEFSITMGGLRAGGGDPWNLEFKNFLRNEWHHISQVTGQPFSFTLLEAPYFDYDTGPACRAVVAYKILQARYQLPKQTILKFFSAVQRKFYVDGQDPKVTDFYVSICAALGLDFNELRIVLESPEVMQEVKQDYLRCRQWGVRSFPTLLLDHRGQIEVLAAGFVTTDQALSRLRLINFF